jgi:cytochrome c oxidase cbb3-type subunit 1
MFLVGAGIMSFNVWQTIAGNLRDEDPLYQPKHDPAADRPLTAVPAE